MPLDHYVPQVHLRRFYSPKLGGKKMFGYKKCNGTSFPCSSKDVCRDMDGSSNSYFENPRAIEEFLKTVEPNYNAAIAAFKSDRIATKDIHMIAGYAAYLSVSTPAAKRMSTIPLKNVVASTAKIMERQGLLPPPPVVFEGKNLEQLLDEQSVEVQIDPSYSQSIVIAQLLELTAIYGNCRWEYVHNRHLDSPFFTSDTAFAIESSPDPRIVNRIFPLAPDFLLRLRPDFNAKQFRKDHSFSQFRRKITNASRHEVININRSIVRCAEHLVFSNHDSPWVENFVRKNSNFGLAMNASIIPFGEEGLMNLFRITVERKSKG